MFYEDIRISIVSEEASDAMVDANSTTVERIDEDEDLSCWLNFSPVYSITSSCIDYLTIVVKCDAGGFRLVGYQLIFRVRRFQEKGGRQKVF